MLSIETLRHALLCQADLTPMLVRLDPDASTGDAADFSSHHRWRNFEKIEHLIDDN